MIVSASFFCFASVPFTIRNESIFCTSWWPVGILHKAQLI